MQIIVLANSWKHGDWCLAGIDPDTGKWVRPVSKLDDGRVPKKVMKFVPSHFPQLLEIIDVPVAPTGPDFGFQCENRSIVPGEWRRCGHASLGDVLKFVPADERALHNHGRYVTVEEMQEKPFDERATLQLVRTDHFRVFDETRNAGSFGRWKCSILSGGREIKMSITDPVYCGKLEAGHKASPACLLTLALSMPKIPQGWDSGTSPCWKIVAGAIELP